MHSPSNPKNLKEEEKDEDEDEEEKCLRIFWFSKMYLDWGKQDDPVAKGIADKLDNLSLIFPRFHIGGVVLWPLHMYFAMHAPTHIHRANK